MSLSKALCKGLLSLAAYSAIGVALVYSQTEQAPLLKRYSNSEVAIYQGDKLSLQVEAEGRKLLYRWVRNYKTICTDAECLFDSAVWGVGTQAVTVVVYNELGSQSLTFNIKVMVRSPERDITTVEPELIEAKDIESLAVGDLYVKAMRGIGYSYVERDIRVIAQLARSLKWLEVLRSHVSGSLIFGVKDQEEHVLSTGGQARLVTIDNRRVIKLEKGSLRSRQLDPSIAPLWSILLQEGLQIDVDKTGDVGVYARAKGSYEIIAFRGNVRLRTIDDAGTVKDVTLKAGEMLSVANIKASYGDIEIPNSKNTTKMFRETSPQYFAGSPSKERVNGAFIHKDAKKFAGQDVSETLKQAKEYLSKNDPLAALEILLYAPKKSRDSAEWSLRVGECYQNLGIHREAFKYFNAAKEKLGDDPSLALIAIGKLMVISRQWQKSLDAFEDVNLEGSNDKQEVLYYQGVAAFNLAKMNDAKLFFKESIWTPNDKDLLTSAYEYLGSAKDSGWFHLKASGRYGSDSNVFHWGSGTRTEGYETAKSMYYSGHLDIDLKAFSSDQSELIFGYHLDRRFYFESALKDFSPMDQRFFIHWSLGIGEDSEVDLGADDRSVLRLEIDPYIHLTSLNGERSADIFGIDTSVQMPNVFAGPKLIIGYANISDPLPAFDDKVDPILLEPVLPSDRSAKLTQYGLGFNVVNLRYKHLEILYAMRSIVHKDTRIKVDDYKEMLLHLDGDTYVTASVPAKLNIQYLTRSFADAEDSRKDTELGLELSLGYEFTSSLSSDFIVDYTTQRSNREIDAYSRTDYSLGLNLNF
jgi:tetratricopeptide (TPR) repeat protein